MSAFTIVIVFTAVLMTLLLNVWIWASVTKVSGPVSRGKLRILSAIMASGVIIYWKLSAGLLIVIPPTLSKSNPAASWLAVQVNTSPPSCSQTPLLRPFRKPVVES